MPLTAATAFAGRFLTPAGTLTARQVAISNRCLTVLVVGPAWIGDMVMAQCLFKVLKSREDAPDITLMAPPGTAELAHRMPEVDEIIETPFEHGRLQMAEPGESAARFGDITFDQAIILPRSLKAALLPFFAKATIRTGYRGEPRWGLVNDPRTRPSTKGSHGRSLCPIGLCG